MDIISLISATVFVKSSSVGTGFPATNASSSAGLNAKILDALLAGSEICFSNAAIFAAILSSVIFESHVTRAGRRSVRNCARTTSGTSAWQTDHPRKATVSNEISIFMGVDREPDF